MIDCDLIDCKEREASCKVTVVEESDGWEYVFIGCSCDCIERLNFYALGRNFSDLCCKSNFCLNDVFPNGIHPKFPNRAIFNHQLPNLSSSNTCSALAPDPTITIVAVTSSFITQFGSKSTKEDSTLGNVYLCQKQTRNKKNANR